MKVVITEAALHDLGDISDYIAADNPVRAESFVDELIDRCESLADQPLAYPLIPRYERYGVRRRVHGSYLILYRIVGERIEVLHVLHGSRDYETILFSDE